MSRQLLIIALLALAVCSPATLLASQIQVSPVRLGFAPGVRVQQLRVGNPGDKAMVVQLELFRWDQADNANHLSPNRDLLATPPILEIPAHSRKVVRIGPRKPPRDHCETPYRVVLTEIPPQAGAHQAPVRFRSQVSLPLFARSQEQCRYKLSWQRRGQRVVISNNGNGHAQIQSAWLQAGAQRWALTLPDVGYVLAGRSRSLVLPDSLPAQALTLHLKMAKDELSGPLAP